MIASGNRYRVRAAWRRANGSLTCVVTEVNAGDACEALLAAWPKNADRPCTHAEITITPLPPYAFATALGAAVDGVKHHVAN
jgi:hypothetical protein